MARAAVTENVWEEVTDDEADSKPHAAKRPTEGLQPAPPLPTRAALAQRRRTQPSEKKVQHVFACTAVQRRCEEGRQLRCRQREEAEARGRWASEEHDVVFRKEMRTQTAPGRHPSPAPQAQ